MTLRKQLKKLGSRAAKRVMANPKAMGAMFQVFGRAQAAKHTLNQVQGDVLHQMSFASRADYHAIGKRISVLKRKVRELGSKLGPPSRR